MAASVPGPREEPPIYVEYAMRGDHHLYDDANDTAAERRPIRDRELWVDMDLVPATPPALNTFDPSPPPGTIVLGIANAGPLYAATGNPYRFVDVGAPVQFANMVPANYYGGVYRPTLRDSAGRVVPYDPAVWVADGVLSVVEFKYRTPAQLGYTPPFTIDYWRYYGRFAAGVFSIVNEGGGAGVYDTASPPNVVLLRSLVPGPGMAVTQQTDTIEISASVASLENVGTGAKVYKGIASNTAQLRTLLGATNGLTVTEGADEISFSNTLEGYNLPSGGTAGAGQLYAAKAGDKLEFNSLAGADGVAVGAPSGGIITIGAASGAFITAIANVGTPGVEVYDTGSPANTANFRRLNAGLGIFINNAPDMQSIQIANTLVGASLGGGTAVYSTKNGATLEFNTLAAGVGGGLSISLASNLITIDNTLVGNNPSNTPSKADVYIEKTGSNLNFRSVVAGSNITVTQAPNDIQIAATGLAPAITVWRIFDSKLTGTQGGPPGPTGWVTRALNVINGFGPNQGSITLVGGTQMAILPGTYYISAVAPAQNAGFNRIVLATGSVAPGTGTVIIQGVNARTAATTVTTNAVLEGWFTVTTAANYRIDHRTQSTTTSILTILGQALGITGTPEIYTQVTIIRIA